MPTDEKIGTEKEPVSRILLLFVGSRRFDAKVCAAWVMIDKDENDGDKLRLKPDDKRIHYFSGKALVKGVQPGTIISIDATMDHKRVQPHTAKVEGVWENDEDITTWNAMHRAVERESEAQGKAVKAIRESLPAAALAPYRRAYQKARNAVQRAQILAFVIEEVTKWE